MKSGFSRLFCWPERPIEHKAMLKTLAFLPFILSSITAPQGPSIAMAENQLIQNIQIEVPFVHQKDDLVGTLDAWAGGSACGPAAIAMALKFHGENYSLYEVINALPTSVYIKGKMFYNLKEGPKMFGYHSTEIEINTEQIYNTLVEGNPILLNIQNYDGITGHEVVVTGIKNYNTQTKTAESLIVNDPFVGPNREFTYINEKTLKQPEGYILPIGIIKPFYITKHTLANLM